ncbi:MAG: DUF1840 domain-containing protein [Burkholderiaceae bacterium]|nr:DUF1840 domain-containing protein [Burkholderiaceae bacterium]
MLYKFKSKAAGDVIMLGPSGDDVLRLVGREPAVRGIFEVQAMPGLIATLHAAVAADEAVRQDNPEDVGVNMPTAGRGDGVALRQRVWPLVEMLRRCHAAREVITWGT